MNIGGGQIRGALFNFFAVEKGPILYLPDAALSFQNNPCIHSTLSCSMTIFKFAILSKKLL